MTKLRPGFQFPSFRSKEDLEETVLTEAGEQLAMHPRAREKQWSKLLEHMRAVDAKVAAKEEKKKKSEAMSSDEEDDVDWNHAKIQLAIRRLATSYTVIQIAIIVGAQSCCLVRSVCEGAVAPIIGFKNTFSAC